ncbi:neutral/alkaline non-lysosomal ceramidase N-terminal domain-containing protein [Tardisphaera miroshnichenkoae]
MIEEGFGKADVTPRGTVELTGFPVGNRKSEGVHDRLFCRSLFLRGEEEFAIISCDLFGFGHEFADEVRNGVANKLGVKPSQVMLAATHTHSSPPTTFLRNGGSVQREYLDLVKNAIEEAAEGSARAAKSTVKYAATRAAGLTFDRVYGSAPDDSLSVIHFKPAQGKKVTLINYACHPSVLGPHNSQISADFPAYIYAIYEAAGEEAIFLNGASGDLNPYLARGQAGTFADAERVGKAIGERSLQEGKEVEAHVLSRSKQVLLERVRPQIDEKALREQIKRWREQGEAVDPKTGLPFGAKADVIEDWLGEIGGSSPSPAVGEAQGVALSKGLALISFSGELFSSVGNLIKLGSPFAETLVIGYANGLVGYIPDAKAFEIGSYEASEAYMYFDTFPFSKNVSKLVVKTSLEVLSSLSAAIASDGI